MSQHIRIWTRALLKYLCSTRPPALVDSMKSGDRGRGLGVQTINRYKSSFKCIFLVSFIVFGLFVLRTSLQSLSLVRQARPPRTAAPELATEPRPPQDQAMFVEFASSGLLIPTRDAMDIYLPGKRSLRLHHANPGTDPARLDYYFLISSNHPTPDFPEEATQLPNPDPWLDWILPDPIPAGARRPAPFRALPLPWDPVVRLLRQQTTSGARDELPGGIRLLVAIISGCCDTRSFARRAAQRSTWVSELRATFPEVTVRFFVAQPSRQDHDLARFDDEVAKHGDLVVLRGEDSYQKLPQKISKMLRYALTAARGYTHVLKTDDDTYVRTWELLRNLYTTERQPNMKHIDIRPLSSGLYIGNVENPNGFHPVRRPESKWFIPPDALPDAEVPWGVQYAAGWGYLLSRDVALRVLRTKERWDASRGETPTWYRAAPWEDVQIGVIAATFLSGPSHHPGFRAAWDACVPSTVVKHLDVDAPGLMEALHAHDRSGLWDIETLPCSTGKFELGNYAQWREWRNAAFPELRV